MMKKILFAFSILMLISSTTCLAKINITRDLYGNIRNKISSNTIPYDDTFNLEIFFIGKSEDVKYQKKIYPMPSFHITLSLVPKDNQSKLLKPMCFLDRSFAYKTEEMEQSLLSIMPPLRDSNNGGFVYYKTSGQYNVYTDDNEVSVQQKVDSYYRGPKIELSYNAKYATINTNINPLDKLTPFNDITFGAYITRALIYNYSIQIGLPYSTNEYKKFDDYTSQEIANLPKKIITVPSNIVQEWQEVAQFKMPDKSLFDEK